MIVKEPYKTRADGVQLVRTYSDEGKRIIQNETGAVYDEAIDVEGASFTYSESAEDAPPLNADEALAIVLGSEVVVAGDMSEEQILAIILEGGEEE